MSNQRWRVPGSSVLLTVLDAGLACCALEFHAAIRAGLLEPAAEPAAEPAGLDSGAEELNVLVVTGTVTDVLAPAVVAAFEALPEPRRCVSFGACSNTGGPYWDSYSVLKGIDQLIPVDVYVPGCPPRPEALVEGLGLLAP